MLGLDHNYDDDVCTCPRNSSLLIEPFKVSNTRTDLRCKRCNGLIGWWDDDPYAKTKPQKKLSVPKRDWTLSEAESMK